MPSSHASTHHSLFFFQKKLKNLFWSSFLRYCALSFATLFSTLFIFEFGKTYSIFPWFPDRSLQQGIFMVIAYILCMRLCILCTIFPISGLSRKIGFVWGIVLSNVCAVGKYISFIFSIHYPWLLFVGAIFQAFEIALYYPNFQTLFTVMADTNKMGRDVGAFDFILKLLHGMLPALSGMLILLLGYSSMFWVAIIFLVASNIPLLFVHTTVKASSPSFKEAWEWKAQPEFGNATRMHIGRYIYDCVSSLWPLYILLIVGQVDRVGFIISMGFFLSLLFTYFSGWLFDKGGLRTSILIGGGSLLVSWGLRLFATASPLIIGVEMLDRVGGSFFFPSLDANMFRFQKHRVPFDCEVYREFFLSISAIFIWIFIGVLVCLSIRWNLLFLFACAGILLAGGSGLRFPKKG